MQNKTKLRLTLLTALAGTLAIGGAALAHPGGGGHGRGGRGGHGFGGRFMKMVERLDLSEAQEVQAVRLRRQLRADREAMRPQMHAARKAMMAEMAKDAPSAAALQASMDQVAALRQQQAQRTLSAILELHKTLTPSQKAKLREHLKRVEARMDERFTKKMMRQGRGAE